MMAGSRKRPREAWIQAMHCLIETVGDCQEWQGRMTGKTPVYSAPAGFAFEGSKAGATGVRGLIYEEHHGVRVPAGHVIRMRCRNDRCCAVEHMMVMTIAESVKEMSRRGELQTLKAQPGRLLAARNRPTKLTMEIAREIRLSSNSMTKEAALRGVTRQTIGLVRAGKLWPEAANGASVFSWRPAA